MVTNRRAYHDYHILETLEAGMVLAGSEVKSLRGGTASMSDCYVRVDDGEAWVINLHIPPYDKSRDELESKRPRKLLLHKAEINKLIGKVKEKGLTLVPLKLYFKRGRAKLEIGLAKGKALHDKRKTIAERQSKRDIERELKEKYK